MLNNSVKFLNQKEVSLSEKRNEKHTQIWIFSNQISAFTKEEGTFRT
jgi:hypothetical protein